MSLDYDDAYARSRDERPFSNHTQWEIWSYNWCDRCARDAPYQAGIAPMGCPLIMLALIGRTPAEWLAETQEQRVYADYTCVEFRPRGGGGGEPRPRPTPPGQGELLPRGDYVGTRMYERQRERVPT